MRFGLGTYLLVEREVSGSKGTRGGVRTVDFIGSEERGGEV